MQSAHAEQISQDLTVIDGTYTSTGNVTISSGVKVTLIRSTWNIPGSVTSLGSNSLILQKSSVIMTSNLKVGFIINAQGGQVNITGSNLISQNSWKYYQFNKCSSLYLNNTLIDGFGVPKGTVNTISSLLAAPSPTISGIHMNNVGKETVISDITDIRMSNVTLSNIQNDTTLITFRNIVGGSVSHLSYNLTKNDRTGSTISYRVEGCSNLVFNRVDAIGLRNNVNTPHYHMVCTGPGGTLLSRNITISNSFFFGGGNGASTGDLIRWVNCTFSQIVDGTEKWNYGETDIVDSRFEGTRDREIELQEGITLDFVRCYFGKGLSNMDNGTAKITNSTFPNGFLMRDYGDNDGTLKHAGTIDQFWNYTTFRVGMNSTWMLSGSTWYVDHNEALTSDYPLDSPNIWIEYITPPQYDLVLSVQGSGSIDPSVGTYTYDKGMVVQVEAYPDVDWVFDHWILLGPTSPAVGSNPFTATMNSTHTLQAVFTQDPLSQDIRFAVITDYGTDNGNELAVANMVKGWSPDFIITTGDNNALGSGQWDRAIGKYYGDYVSTGRFFPR